MNLSFSRVGSLFFLSLAVVGTTIAGNNNSTNQVWSKRNKSWMALAIALALFLSATIVANPTGNIIKQAYALPADKYIPLGETLDGSYTDNRIPCGTGYNCVLKSGPGRLDRDQSGSYYYTWENVGPVGDYVVQIEHICIDCQTEPYTVEYHIHVYAPSPAIDLQLSKNSIKPRMGKVDFSGIVSPSTGQVTGSTGTQLAVSGGQSNIIVTLTGGINQNNIPASLTFKPIAGSGGHNHFSSTATDVIKKAFGGFVTSSGAVVLKYSGYTNSEGVFTSKFKAVNLNSQGESSAAGQIQIIATAQVGGQTITDTITLNIKVSGLQKLSSGTGYSLVGSTSNHVNNHYGTSNANTALKKIASDYLATFKGSILRYNDQSLVWGGKFDIAGGWVGSHYSHSCGTDIDVGTTDRNGKRIDQKTFAGLIAKYYSGAFVILESRGTANEHYHIHFANCT